ncbi:MAG: hydrogen peroxide-inducible genes activator [Rhodospirillales bacterium]|jgi:LysR family hydrogen peroxide-inducible transcriptional activator|nr:hydrogen peroxide-inducible genes activator [Rhodospirillales bacterium]MBT3907904.1 hydrogen peroxide-inducible genes activator [Rhodospirillaceae bacterium]MBT5035661.1 hydrogen peroxide-inducible genes activator [Rhodospirillaceae bacterium]MBT6218664.1 hydrogen peroxide-inducible genes activator [Rhodospirillaceae bacterium]MBT6363558.1 hydrogen peroxide-inducible genes activator [Rhodospirillaceae bacterium]
MQPEPTLRQLRHFLSLAEHCHFSRAAEACLLTQSSLSASIKELEGVLGVTLFERTKRSVMLTPLGREMVGLAKTVTARVDDLTDAVKGAGAPLAGDLRMGVIPTISPFLLPRVLPGLREAYPDLQLYLREEQTASLLRQLADGDLDTVLMALPYKTEKVDVFEFADDPFLIVFPRGHEMEKFETATPARLKRDALLVMEEGNCLTDQTLAMGTLSERVGRTQFQASSLHTLVQMVDNGLGLTILPKMAVDAGILRGLKLNFRPFSSPKASRHIALAWRKTSQRGEEFRMLGQYLRDELGTPVPQT